MAQEPPNEITGSHEEFYTFSQVSQWGSHWKFSNNENLNQIHEIVIITRKLGLDLQFTPRLVHTAQMLLWRFYLKNDPKQDSPIQIVPLAYESAGQILETQSQFVQLYSRCEKEFGSHFPINGQPSTDAVKKHFQSARALDFNFLIHHPSEYLSQFVTSEFDESEGQLAQTIISDSYLCPCCLVHTPKVIAEGAAIMAAAMTNRPTTVIPRTSRALSFIQDMKYFYKQSINSVHSTQQAPSFEGTGI